MLKFTLYKFKRSFQKKIQNIPKNCVFKTSISQVFPREVHRTPPPTPGCWGTPEIFVCLGHYLLKFIPPFCFRPPLLRPFYAFAWTSYLIKISVSNVRDTSRCADFAIFSECRLAYSYWLLWMIYTASVLRIPTLKWWLMTLFNDLWRSSTNTNCVLWRACAGKYANGGKSKWLLFYYLWTILIVFNKLKLEFQKRELFAAEECKKLLCKHIWSTIGCSLGHYETTCSTETNEPQKRQFEGGILNSR